MNSVTHTCTHTYWVIQSLLHKVTYTYTHTYSVIHSPIHIVTNTYTQRDTYSHTYLGSCTWSRPMQRWAILPSFLQTRPHNIHTTPVQVPTDHDLILRQHLTLPYRTAKYTRRVLTASKKRYIWNVSSIMVATGADSILKQLHEIL